MCMHRVRRLMVATLVAGSLLVLPAAAAAKVDGGCEVTGTATSTGSIDLTTATEWHLQSTDIAGGSGTAPSTQTSASVAAYALGLPLPIASGSGDGDTAGSVDGVSVSTYAILGARFTVAGSSSGEGGGCSGQVQIIIDDVNPLLTVLGGGGLAVAIVAGVILLLSMRTGGGLLWRFVGLLLGALGGGGLGLSLEQFGVLDPTTLIGLIVLAVGAVLGLVLPGLLGRSSPA